MTLTLANRLLGFVAKVVSILKALFPIKKIAPRTIIHYHQQRSLENNLERRDVGKTISI